MTFRERLQTALSPTTLVIGLVGAALAGAIWSIALERLGYEYQLALSSEASQNANLAESHSERATRSLQVLDQILLFIRAEHLMHGLPKTALKDLLRAVQVDDRYVGIVAVIDAQGTALAITADAPPATNYSDRDYFKVHAADPTDRLLIGPPILGRLSGQWIVTLTRRISLADGSFGGVVFLALNPAFFTIDYEKAQLNPNSSVALIGLDGITRARRNGDKVSYGDNASASQLFKEIPKAPVGLYTGVAASDGQRRLVSYQVMDNYPMVTVVASSLKDIDAMALDRKRLYFSTAAGSSALVCALAGLSILVLARRRRGLAIIAESERRYRLLFENSQDAVISTRPDGQVLSANPAACALFGLQANALAQVRSLQLFDASDPRCAALSHQTPTGGKLQGQMRMLRSDGSPFEAEVSATRCPEGEALCSMIIRDITERQRAEDQIKNLAFYDPLTQLPNRRLLMDRLHITLANSNRHQRLAALLFVDLDNFKTLNDTRGHQQGDLLLQQVATRLLTCVRESDTCARLGGDEFVVVLDDLGTDPLAAASQAEVIGRKILAALNQNYPLGPYSHHSTPSIGITLFGRGEDENIDEPLKRADLAMYQAKAAGRNTLRFFDAQIQAAVAARSALELSLRQAVAQQDFVLYYQPQVEATGQVTGAEVLVRWLHPERGLVSPAEFIPLAEDTGLILPLGQWVLTTACQQLARWASHPQRGQLTLAVNVSERQFHQTDFVEQVLSTLRQTGARASQLKLELTEGLLVTQFDDVIAKMSALKAHGVGFSLDDFGTGYSSLAYLKRLPLDQLKIDQSFVRDILVDPNDAAIANMVVVLAQSLGLQVIAEGVETEAQRAKLASQGCHHYQGYLFSRPLPSRDFEDWLANSATGSLPSGHF